MNVICHFKRREMRFFKENKILIGVFILFFCIGLTKGHFDTYSKKNLTQYFSQKARICFEDSVLLIKTSDSIITYSLVTKKIKNPNSIYDFQKSQKINLLEESVKYASAFLGGGSLIFNYKSIYDLSLVQKSFKYKAFKVIKTATMIVSGYFFGYIITKHKPNLKNNRVISFLKHRENWENITNTILIAKIFSIKESKKESIQLQKDLNTPGINDLAKQLIIEDLEYYQSNLFKARLKKAKTIERKYNNDSEYSATYIDFEIFKE